MSDPCVELAKQAIRSYFEQKKQISPPENINRFLLSKRVGIFVSIHKKPKHNEKEGELRGCIGTFLPTKNCIASEIIDNAISAATKDFRFMPIEKSELNDLEISVDELSTPEPIQSIGGLDPRKYGVIVKSEDGKTGLLLPDIEGVNDAAYQVAVAKQKAGITPKEKIYLYRFTVIRHKE
jgi:AmmeMemoRadiSam system protein A